MRCTTRPGIWEIFQDDFYLLMLGVGGRERTTEEKGEEVGKREGERSSSADSLLKYP